MKNKVLIVLVVLAVIAFEYWDNNGGSLPDNNSQSQQGGSSVHRAFDQRLTDVQLQGVGVVKKVLADDLDGSRHQRFILDVGQQLSILVAHNIDLVDKIKPLQRGDTVEFYGEYEWTNKGGVVHWTHHDPAGKHPGGWLKHLGITYK